MNHDYQSMFIAGKPWHYILGLVLTAILLSPVEMYAQAPGVMLQKRGIELLVLSQRRIQRKEITTGRDLGTVTLEAGFDSKDLAVLGDVNGDGAPDVAVLGQRGQQVEVDLRDLNTGERLSALICPEGQKQSPGRLVFNMLAEGLKVAVLDDINRNCTPEIAVLGRAREGGATQVIIQDIQRGAVPRNMINFPNSTAPQHLIVLSDVNRNQAPELAVVSGFNGILLERQDVKDPSLGMTFDLSASLVPRALLRDVSCNGIPEIASLSQSNQLVFRDASGNPNVSSLAPRQLTVAPSFVPADLTVFTPISTDLAMPQMNLAVLSVQQNRGQVIVVEPVQGQLPPRNFSFEPGFTPQSLAVVNDEADGQLTPILAVWAVNETTNAVAVQLQSIAGARIGRGTVTFSNASAPAAMMVLGGLSNIAAGSRRRLAMQLTNALNQPVAQAGTPVRLRCLDSCRGRELPLSLVTDAMGQAMVTFQVNERVRSDTNVALLNRVSAQVGGTRVIYEMPTVPDRRGARQLQISERLVEGEPQKPLARPLVVAVRDQFGNPFRGVLVQASVTEGRGTLSLSDTSAVCSVRGTATVQGATVPTGNAVALTDDNGEVRFDLTVNEFSNGQVQVETEVPEVEANRLVFRVVRSRPQVGDNPSDLVARDLNGDSLIDLVTANADSDNLSVLIGSGDAFFQTPTTLPVRDHPVAVAVADLNNNGLLDLITANERSADVSILMGSGDGFFQSPIPQIVGNRPVSIEVADIDGNGDLDIITANQDDNEIAILMGNGDGSFQSPTPFPVGDQPVAIAVADLNGDGDLDIITANQDSDNISILMGNGDGSFQSPTSLPVGDQPVAIAVADLDGDGNLDVITTNQGSNDVSILIGNDDGSLQISDTLSVGNGPSAVAVANVNGDEILDLIIANEFSDDISILAGDVNGSFQTLVAPPVGVFPKAIAVADVNGDDKLDLITVNSFADDVSIILGNGDGSFQTPTTLPVGGEPLAVEAADLNNDRNIDIVTANRGSNDVSILTGNGNGSFQDQVTLPVGDLPSAITVADINNDGNPDIIIANTESDNVSTLINLGDGQFGTPPLPRN